MAQSDFVSKCVLQLLFGYSNEDLAHECNYSSFILKTLNASTIPKGSLLSDISQFLSKDNPFQILDSLSTSLGNPILWFHLLNLFYRHNLIVFTDLKLFNNYQFWNTRALRQYLVYLLKLHNQSTLIIEFIRPYLDQV